LIRNRKTENEGTVSEKDKSNGTMLHVRSGKNMCYAAAPAASAAEAATQQHHPLARLVAPSASAAGSSSVTDIHPDKQNGMTIRLTV